MISYRRLWNTMRERGVTQYMLINKYHVSPGQITRMKRDESVSTHTIEMFCRILDCRVEDVMEYISDHDTDGLTKRIACDTLVSEKKPPGRHERI